MFEQFKENIRLTGETYTAARQGFKSGFEAFKNGENAPRKRTLSPAAQFWAKGLLAGASGLASTSLFQLIVRRIDARTIDTFWVVSAAVAVIGICIATTILVRTVNTKPRGND